MLPPTNSPTDPLQFLDFNPDFSAPAHVSGYDEMPLWSAMFGLLLLEHVPLGGKGRALDVGCGTGFPLIELAERLGPRWQVDGVDPWSQALARAREKIAGRRLLHVTVHEASATQMPFPDATFDLIVSRPRRPASSVGSTSNGATSSSSRRSPPD